MTFDDTAGHWIDVCDDDVRWALAQGFNADELAHIAHCSAHAAAWWMAEVLNGNAVVPRVPNPQACSQVAA